MSWIELRAWIKHPPADSRLLAVLRSIAAAEAEAAKPADERVVGTAPGSAIPIDELDAWLGWNGNVPIAT